MITLPAEDEILISRAFDAPRHLVFRAYTEPELVERWWAGRRGTVTLVEIDLRVGGRWRFVMQADGGYEVGFHGEYREIVPDERIVTTEVYEGMPETGEPALNIVTFEESEGRTTLSILMRVASREQRDMILQTGMETGVREQMELLEELTASLVSA